MLCNIQFQLNKKPTCRICCWEAHISKEMVFLQGYVAESRLILVKMGLFVWITSRFNITSCLNSFAHNSAQHNIFETIYLCLLMPKIKKNSFSFCVLGFYWKSIVRLETAKIYNKCEVSRISRIKHMYI